MRWRLLAIVTVLAVVGGGAQRPPVKRPDLSGIWQALNTANWNLEGHAAGPGVPALGALTATPPGRSVVEGGTIPYRPEALARRRANYENRWTADPEAKCFYPGVPRATYMPYPFQIIQGTSTVLVAYEYASAVRTIHLDKPREAFAESWMGTSFGMWQGDTLVVDVVGLDGQTWFDRAGNHHSDALHVVERYRMLDANTLWYTATIEDAATFTRPWTIAMPLYRRREPGAQLLEFKCVEFAEEMLYGRLRKGVAP
ncbi:MAG: hypothetical protein AB7I25_08475 [Vicinamibacterales bacterium]